MREERPEADVHLSFESPNDESPKGGLIPGVDITEWVQLVQELDKIEWNLSHRAQPLLYQLADSHTVKGADRASDAVIEARRSIQRVSDIIRGELRLLGHLN